MPLDELDHKILRTMQAYPDLSLQEIGERVGLSHTPCWRRVRRMEEDGVIQGRVVLLNPKALNLTVTVYAEVKLKNHNEETLDALDKATKTLPEIMECYAMSGDSDYLLKIVVESIEKYEIFLKKNLLHMPGVAAVNSSFALKCVKLTTKLPI